MNNWDLSEEIFIIDNEEVFSKEYDDCLLLITGIY